MGTHVPVSLAPKAGFCIKSSTLAPGIIRPPVSPQSHHTHSLLEPPQKTVPIPKGRKVFLNIAWDPSVPPPPEGSEAAIQAAMQASDAVDHNDNINPNAWYVPVIVSNPREDIDKAGNPSLVFDCIYNTSVKPRTLRDAEFKVFLIELALQRIEDQTGLSLSRNIGSPNIASKGKLLPRTAHLPAALLQSNLTSSRKDPLESLVSASPLSSSSREPPLIQEVTSSNKSPGDDTAPKSEAAAAQSLPGLRGILKSSAAASPQTTPSPSVNNKSLATSVISSSGPLTWSWKKLDSPSDRIKIEVFVPGLTAALIRRSTLDIEPRVLALSVPHHHPLNIDLSLSDAEIASRVGAAWSSPSYSSSSKSSRKGLSGSTPEDKDKAEAEAEIQKYRQEETTRTLQLKRQRDFDVDGAEAEWKVGSGVVKIYL